MEHNCGCQTGWSDDLDHPIYMHACAIHRQFVRDWVITEMPTVRALRPRESVSH